MSQSGEISPETAADAPANHNNESITTCSTRPSHVPFERNATRTTHQTADVGFNDITQYGGSRSMRPQPSLWMKRETGEAARTRGGNVHAGKVVIDQQGKHTQFRNGKGSGGPTETQSFTVFNRSTRQNNPRRHHRRALPSCLTTTSEHSDDDATG